MTSLRSHCEEALDVVLSYYVSASSTYPNVTNFALVFFFLYWIRWLVDCRYRAAVSAPKKVVVVTGAAQGVGAAAVTQLSAAGCHVWALDMQIEKLENGVGKLPNVTTMQANVTSEADALAVVAAMKKIGVTKLYGLVNNAGILQDHATLLESSVERMQMVVNVNTFGMVRMVQAFFPLLQASSEACIVNVTSYAGLVALPTYGAYAMSKYAAEAFSDILRRELLVARSTVRVKVVEPLWVGTAILQQTKDVAYSNDDIRKQPNLKVVKWINESQAIPSNTMSPEHVGDRVCYALFDRSRRTRYPVALGIQWLLNNCIMFNLPHHVQDGILNFMISVHYRMTKDKSAKTTSPTHQGTKSPTPSKRPKSPAARRKVK